MDKTVGFIGLGSMGIPMAKNLIAAGYDLRVYNRTPAKAQPVIDAGARLCATPAEVVQGVNLVVTMLADDATVEEVSLGKEGILRGLAPGGIHLSASTISPQISRTLAQRHAQQGCHYLASPVFGRPPAAEGRKLHIALSGGNADIRAQSRHVLEAMGQSVWEFGDDPGAANVVKLCGNFLAIAAAEALAEAFTLAEKNGMDRVAVCEMLTQTIFATPLYQGYGRMIASGVYEPVSFSLPLALKDVRLIEALGSDSQTPLPLAALLDQKMVSALAKGYGHLDSLVFAREASEAAGLKPTETEPTT